MEIFKLYLALNGGGVEIAGRGNVDAEMVVAVFNAHQRRRVGVVFGLADMVSIVWILDL
ncbi:MAG: hypothetical protein AAGL24_00580 [Pseudomonadota bacterium]